VKHLVAEVFIENFVRRRKFWLAEFHARRLWLEMKPLLVKVIPVVRLELQQHRLGILHFGSELEGFVRGQEIGLLSVRHGVQNADPEQEKAQQCPTEPGPETRCSRSGWNAVAHERSPLSYRLVACRVKS
jgi:hypothetical protein